MALSLRDNLQHLQQLSQPSDSSSENSLLQRNQPPMFACSSLLLSGKSENNVEIAHTFSGDGSKPFKT